METFATNIMGTVNVLEACRRVAGVKAAICITTDKCYENREWVWPYREADPMGGHDPYSSSKGAAELVIASYRRSFFENGGTAVASVRAGNVIGGGDWALDRLIPDIVRAMLAGERPVIRSPGSVRPWQHVLEALGGYLLIAERLLGGDRSVATAYNFGPSDDDAQPVSFVVEQMLRTWGASGWDQPDLGKQPHEAALLRLDCSKARAELGWRPTLRLEQALTGWWNGTGRSPTVKTQGLSAASNWTTISRRWRPDALLSRPMRVRKMEIAGTRVRIRSPKRGLVAKGCFIVGTLVITACPTPCLASSPMVPGDLSPVATTGTGGTLQRPSIAPRASARHHGRRLAEKSQTLFISSPFGWRHDPFGREGRPHEGIDLPGRFGSPVHSTGNGVVTYAGWMNGYGNLVQIDHPGGLRTRYGHLSRIMVRDGEAVEQGEVVGQVGIDRPIDGKSPPL